MRSPRYRRRGGTGQPPAPVSRERAPRLRPAANFAGESGVGAGSWEVGRGGKGAAELGMGWGGGDRGAAWEWEFGGGLEVGEHSRGCRGGDGQRGGRGSSSLWGHPHLVSVGLEGSLCPSTCAGRGWLRGAAAEPPPRTRCPFGLSLEIR